MRFYRSLPCTEHAANPLHANSVADLSGFLQEVSPLLILPQDPQCKFLLRGAPILIRKLTLKKKALTDLNSIDKFRAVHLILMNKEASSVNTNLVLPNIAKVTLSISYMTARTYRKS